MNVNDGCRNTTRRRWLNITMKYWTMMTKHCSSIIRKKKKPLFHYTKMPLYCVFFLRSSSNPIGKMRCGTARVRLLNIFHFGTPPLFVSAQRFFRYISVTRLLPVIFLQCFIERGWFFYKDLLRFELCGLLIPKYWRIIFVK